LSAYMTYCRRLIRENHIEAAIERVCKPMFLRTANEFFRQKPKAEVRTASATITLAGLSDAPKSADAGPARSLDSQRLEDLARPRILASPASMHDEQTSKAKRLDVSRMAELAIPRHRAESEDGRFFAGDQAGSKTLDVARLQDLARPRNVLTQPNDGAGVAVPCGERVQRELNRTRLLELSLPRLPRCDPDVDTGGLGTAAAVAPHTAKHRRADSAPVGRRASRRSRRRSKKRGRQRANSGGGDGTSTVAASADVASVATVGEGDDSSIAASAACAATVAADASNSASADDDAIDANSSSDDNSADEGSDTNVPSPPPPPPLPDPPIGSRPLDLARLTELAPPRKLCEDGDHRWAPCACSPGNVGRRKRRSKLRLLALVQERQGDNAAIANVGAARAATVFETPSEEAKTREWEEKIEENASVPPERALALATQSPTTLWPAEAVAVAKSSLPEIGRVPPPPLFTYTSPPLAAAFEPECRPRGGGVANAGLLGNGLARALENGAGEMEAGLARDSSEVATSGFHKILGPMARLDVRRRSRPPCAPANHTLRNQSACTSASASLWKAVPIKTVQFELAL